MAFAAWTGFGDGRGNNDSSRANMILTGAACSEGADLLCLETPSSELKAGLDGAFALQRTAVADAATDRILQQAATATPAAEATPGPQPEPTPEPVTYASMVVREGDTLVDLANWFAVSPFDIAVFNSFAVDDWLYTGQTLWIPIPEDQFVMPPEVLIETSPPAVVAPVPAPQQPPAAIIAPPAPAPTPPPSSGSWTKEEVVAAICSLPWDCTKMVAVAACESGLRPDAFNPIGYYGIFQINYSFPGWDDPWVNASVAYYDKYLPALNWSGDGLSPWPVCRHY